MNHISEQWFQVITCVADKLVRIPGVLAMHDVTRKEIKKIYDRINQRSQMNRVVRVNMDTITASVQRVREYARRQLASPARGA